MFISNNAKISFISFDRHCQVFVTLGDEITFSKSSSILHFRMLRENVALKHLSRLVWMQVVVRAPSGCQCRIANLRLPSQGLWLWGESSPDLRCLPRLFLSCCSSSLQNQCTMQKHIPCSVRCLSSHT